MSVAAPKLVEPATKPRPGDTAIIQRLEVAPTEFIGDAIPAGSVETSPARVRAKPGPRVRPTPVPPASVPPVSVPPVSVPPVSAPPVVSPTVVPAPTAPPATAPPATAPPATAPPATVPPAAVPAPPRIAMPPRPAPPKPAPPLLPLSMPTPASEVASAAASTPAPIATPAPVAAPAPDDDDRHNDLEETRIVASRLGDRFVLQFSTGENSTVYGTGLVGRNPVTQPGEYVDQVVTILDPGKSVSKTHVEFGQTAGAFWVVDRYSANGTIVRQPDAPPQRLDPGKRQPVARGTRVDMGEQFFVVS